MVHRPFRMAEILAKMRDYGMEPKRLRMVHPYIDREPNMLLVEGLRGAKPGMVVEPPLIVFEKSGSYTEEAMRMNGSGRREEVLMPGCVTDEERI